jgi:hypothetical protein
VPRRNFAAIHKEATMRELTQQEIGQVDGGYVEQCRIPLSWSVRFALDSWFSSWERDF